MDDKFEVDSKAIDASVSNRGIIHAFASKSPSSIKTQMVKATANDRLQKSRTLSLSRRHRRLRTRKDYKLNSLNNINISSGYTAEELNKHLYFFKTNIYDPIYEEILFKCNEDYREVMLFNEMNVLLETSQGCKLMEGQKNNTTPDCKSNASKVFPVVILVPRKDVLEHTPSAHADVASLKKLLDKHNKTTARGSKKTGICKRYATLGAHASRNKHGMENTIIHNCCLRDFNHIKSMVDRAVFFGKMWLPFGLMSTVRHMKNYVNDRTSIHQSDKDPASNVWASIATSFNYVSPSHQDKDSFLSCLMVSFIPHNHPVNEVFQYTENMAPAVFLCLISV
jgi:hypothetical protein